MSKIIEIDSSVLEMALLAMWWKGFKEYERNERWNDDRKRAIDLEHLDQVKEQYLGGKLE